MICLYFILTSSLVTFILDALEREDIPSLRARTLRIRFVSGGEEKLVLGEDTQTDSCHGASLGAGDFDATQQPTCRSQHKVGQSQHINTHQRKLATED